MDTLRDCIDILARKRGQALAIFVGTLAVTAAGLVLSPRAYQSEAKLFVRVGRESVTLDPTATTGQMISVYESRESEINSVIDVLNSRVILDRVVDRLGPRQLLSPARAAVLPASWPAATPAVAAVSGPAPAVGRPLMAAEPGTPAAREQALQFLENSLNVSHGKKSSVITLTAKAGSPELAQRILQTVLDTFQAEHLRINRTSGSHEFFVSQADMLQKQLEQALEELRDAKNKVGVSSLEGHRKSIQDQYSLLQTATLDTDSALSAAQATIRALQESLAKLPERLMSSEVTGFPNDAADHARHQLNTLRIREQELLTRYTPLHPAVAAVRQQKQQAEQILEQRNAPIRQSTNLVNPARQQLELKLLDEESRAAALGAKAQALHQQSAQLQKKLESLNNHEGRIEQLQKRVELLQTNFRAYSEKVEQARIDQALEQDNISNVNVVQPATLNSTAVSPKKLLVLVLGLFLAVTGSLGWPLLTVFRSRWLAVWNSPVSARQSAPAWNPAMNSDAAAARAAPPAAECPLV